MEDSPVMRATLPMPRPLASSCRAREICLGSAPSRPRRLRTMPALAVKCPSRLILALMALSPAFTRCRIMLRSNSEKAPVTWKRSLPVGEVVSRFCYRVRVVHRRPGADVDLIRELALRRLGPEREKEVGEPPADGFEILDSAQEINEGAAETVYGPGHDHIELPANCVLEHGVEARPLVPALGAADASILVDLDEPANRGSRRPP
jgi:hypothetical protein